MRRLGCARTLLPVLLVAVLALSAASCRGDSADVGSAPIAASPVDSSNDGDVSNNVSAEQSAVATLFVLPERLGPRTETTHSVPHVQNFVEPVDEVDVELRRRIYSLPGIENRETIVSFTGTTALWLSEGVEPSTLVATMRSREFGHIHPDGSLHTVLPVDRAIEATTAKWAELHPWVGREDFWDGLVMLYTPQNFEELEVTWQLIVESYNFVTGQNLNAADFRS